VGYITPVHTYSPGKLQAVAARSIWNDPRIYKPIISLKELGIEKTLKSVVLEVRDSVARLYYILDSSCFFIDFQCDYQTLELVKELPTEVIHYLRILCSKKGRLELIVREDTLYLLFEDTFPSKMPAKERKEKEVDKYVLSVPLREVDSLDLAVTEFVKEVVELEDTSPISYEEFNLPVDFSSITINKEPIEYWMSVVSTPKGDFKIVDTSGINSTLVVCPVEVGRNALILEFLRLDVEDEKNKDKVEDLIDRIDNYKKFKGFSPLKIKKALREAQEEAAKRMGWIPEKDGDIEYHYPDYLDNYEEDIQDLNDAAELVDSFMTDSKVFQENDEYLEMMNDIMEDFNE
jgi:hypothetical protein